MSTESITIRQLFEYAQRHNLADATLRICDGMAVHYYPDAGSLYRSRFEIVIDVSALDPIDYDELNPQVQHAWK